MLRLPVADPNVRLQRALEFKPVFRQTRPWQRVFKSAKGRAKFYRIPFTLTDEWAAARFTGRCELSGLPFVFGKTKSMFVHVFLEH